MNRNVERILLYRSECYAFEEDLVKLKLLYAGCMLCISRKLQKTWHLPMIRTSRHLLCGLNTIIWGIQSDGSLENAIPY